MANMMEVFNNALDRTEAALARKPVATYSRCVTCGMIDAPSAGTCLDCYMRGKPYRMKDVFEGGEQ